MDRDAIDLGRVHIPKLFRLYFIPTLLGMLSLCVVTATDGIFVGRGAGGDALAAVNICIAPTMVIMGIGLMLGMGASVVSSIHLSKNNVKAARLNITQALLTGSVVAAVFIVLTLSNPFFTAFALGSSETLLPLVLDYMPWIFLCCLFQMWGSIGLFVIRLDGSPQYAMWCNIIPGLLNIVLDYVFIFPLGMGIKGAGIATCISCFVGGLMVLVYLGFFAYNLNFIKIKLSRRSFLLTCRNIGYQCKIGVSAFLGETTMGMLMLMGNLVFMEYLGDKGVGAFSIACYYCPFAFMIGNSIAQAAQPIISYNYGMSAKQRVIKTERLAIISAVICGLIVTATFILIPNLMVGLFIVNSPEILDIAVHGFPWFSCAFVFFIFNLTAIGYFQSVEKALPAIIFALFRGAVFLIPAFLILPNIMGVPGIWMSLGVSEFLTSLCIVFYYLFNKAAPNAPNGRRRSVMSGA